MIEAHRLNDRVSASPEEASYVISQSDNPTQKKVKCRFKWNQK